MSRRSIGLLVAVATALLLASSAGAVNLPRSQSQFSSAQIVDGRLVWFQRNDRPKRRKGKPTTVKAGVGAIYSRVLTEKTATRVYLPSKGQKIVSFKTGGGRVVVGLATIAKDSRGPSQIVELTPGAAAPWPAKTLAGDSDVEDATTCRSRVELVGAQPNGDVIVQRDKIEGRGKDCVLVRQTGQLTTYPKNGPETPLADRKSGWANAELWTLLPALAPAANGWMLQTIADGWSEGLTPVSTWNAASGESHVLTGPYDEVDRVEALAGGGLIMRAYWADHFLLPSAAKPDAKRLYRNGHESWIHACGSQIVEFARAWDRPDHGKWKIYLRDASGKTTKKLATKLPLGTMFDACDQTTAVFHRPRHDGGAHQWKVDLTK